MTLALWWWLAACRPAAPDATGTVGPIDSSQLETGAADSGRPHTGETGLATFNDLDRDGYGIADCDDEDASIHPGAQDPFGDGVDSDCDGSDGPLGAHALGPWAFGEFGVAIDVADIDGDGLDEVVSGAPAEFIYSDEEVQAGAVIVMESDLSSVALLHGERNAKTGRSVVFLRHEGGWRVASLAQDGDIRGGATYITDLPAADGGRLDDVSVARIPGTHGGVNARRLHAFEDHGLDELYAVVFNYGVGADDKHWQVSPLEPSTVVLDAPDPLFRSTLNDALGLHIVRNAESWWLSRNISPESVGAVLRYDSVSSSGLATSDATLEWMGAHEYAYFGSALALLDDGARSLLAVGSPGENTDYERGGRVYVFDANADEAALESAVAVIHADVSSRFLGWSLLAPGDVDGDGIDDLLVGAPGDFYTSPIPGEAWLFRGPIRGDLTVADAAWVVKGTVALDRTGAGLASGDFDGDGRVDLLIGRPGYSELPLNPTMGRIDRVLNREMGW